MMTTPHSGSWVVHGFFCLVCVFILVAIKSICGWYLMYVFHVFCTLHIQHMFVSSDWCCACQIFAFNEKSRRIALLRVFLGSKSVKDNHLRSPAIFYMYSYMYIRAALRGPSARTGVTRWLEYTTKPCILQIFFYSMFIPWQEKTLVFMLFLQHPLGKSSKRPVFGSELRKHWFLQCFFDRGVKLCRE